MNVQLLIDAIVRQTTVLIAQLATAGGIRAPLAHIADEVFTNLALELEAQGVSRKVGADMFGMALRAYQKKIQRLRESSTVRGQSLWSAVLNYIDDRGVATRADVLGRFRNDDVTLVRGVLWDLVESGLLSSSGSGPSAVFRKTTPEASANGHRHRATCVFGASSSQCHRQTKSSRWRSQVSCRCAPWRLRPAVVMAPSQVTNCAMTAISWMAMAAALPVS